MATSKSLPPIEITVSVSGKIPRRQFENYAPLFSVKEFLPSASKDIERESRQVEIHNQLENIFTAIRDKILLEELQAQFKNLRFTLNPEDGRKYPHVTDILYWDENFYISPDELAQYGARGTAIHSMIDHWIETGKWTEDAIHRKDMIILKKGTKRLYDTLSDINFLGFMEKYGKEIKFGEGEIRVFNKEHFYTGRFDRVGTYEDRPAIFDFKCREAKDVDFEQLGAYVSCDHPLLKSIRDNKGLLVVIPLNSTNKSGFGKPVVEEDIGKYFNLFLRERQDYKDRFGV